MIDAALHNEVIQTISRSDNSNELNAILMRKLLGQTGVVLLRDSTDDTTSSTSTTSSSSCSYCEPAKSAKHDFIDSSSSSIAPAHSLSRTSRTRLHKISSQDAPPATKIEIIKSYTSSYHPTTGRFYQTQSSQQQQPTSILLMIQQQQQQQSQSHHPSLVFSKYTSPSSTPTATTMSKFNVIGEQETLV